MPDLNITAGSVAQITTPTGNQIPTVTGRGTVGGTVSIAPGQVVYADPSANNLLKLAQATSSFQAANVVGIALGSAAPNQPLTYAVSGDIQLQTTGAGSTLTSGSVYILSVNAGNLVSVVDAPGTVHFVTVLGVGNGTVTGATNIFRLNLIAGAAQQ